MKTRHEVGTEPGMLQLVVIIAILATIGGAWTFRYFASGGRPVADESNLIKSQRVESTVEVAAFSRNGEMVATSDTSDRAAGRYAVRIWNALTGKEISHTAPIGVSQIVFARNTKFFAVAGNEGLWLFSTATGLVEAQVKSRLQLFSVAVSHDDKLVAYGGMDGTVVLWNIDQRKPIGAYALGCWIESLTFTPDSTGLAAGCGTPRGMVYPERKFDELNPIYLVTINNGTWLKLGGHYVSSNQLVFTRNGKTIASGGYDGKIKFWDRNSGEMRGELGLECRSDHKGATFPSRVTGLLLDDEGDRLFASSNCGRIAQIKIPSMEVTTPSTSAREPVLAIGSNENGQLLTIDGDGHIETRVWR